MGRSKLGASFLTSAGARLMVVRPRGFLKPELVSAVLTRSRDSFTAASGKPTITITLSPQPELTSTSTGKASMPLTAAENTRASMPRMMIKRRAERNRKTKGLKGMRICHGTFLLKTLARLFIVRARNHYDDTTRCDQEDGPHLIVCPWRAEPGVARAGAVQRRWALLVAAAAVRGGRARAVHRRADHADTSRQASRHLRDESQ